MRVSIGACILALALTAQGQMVDNTQREIGTTCGNALTPHCSVYSNSRDPHRTHPQWTRDLPADVYPRSGPVELFEILLPADRMQAAVCRVETIRCASGNFTIDLRSDAGRPALLFDNPGTLSPDYRIGLSHLRFGNIRLQMR